jgi:hypothetical protein
VAGLPPKPTQLRLHTWKVSDRLYLVKSRRYAPGTHHAVHVDPDTGRVTLCDRCPGWQFTGTCAHAAAVERRLAREMKRRPALARARIDEDVPLLMPTRGRSQLYQEEA